MTLHEAIVQVLKNTNRAMTTQEIADELNRTKAYQKRDGSLISAFQIHGRTRNYSQLFDRDKSLVSLKGSTKSASPLAANIPIEQSVSDSTFMNTESNLVEQLMNESNYKTAVSIDTLVPNSPGIYCIRIKNIDALPKPFNTELSKRGHNIIYIGVASQSLNKRMLNQELRAKGHGTFFRSLGAVLGFRPPFNSLADKKNKRNYKFSLTDEAKIIEWINENLLVNWIEQASGLEEGETALILEYKPLLNIAKNPYALIYISLLRKECVEIANRKN